MAFWVFSINSYSMANILMKDYILTILWWAIILLLMPTILSFAMNPTEHWIIFLGIVIALAVPLTFTK